MSFAVFNVFLETKMCCYVVSACIVTKTTGCVYVCCNSGEEEVEEEGEEEDEDKQGPLMQVTSVLHITVLY